MASTYTPLGVELMATGENAGTWGTKTNNNLSLIAELTGGFAQVDIAGSAQTTALTVVDGATTGTAQRRMIEFTGTISGNQIVTIPNDVETFYILRNSTSGSHTVQFKYATGSGSTFTFSATDKGDKIVFAAADDGTNPNIKTLAIGTGISAVVDDTTPQLGGDLDMNGNDIVTTSNANIDLNPNGSGVVNLVGNSTRAATLRFNEDTDDGSNYVELKAGTIGSNLSFTLPTADGTSGQALVTDGSGALSFSTAGITTGKAIAMAIVFG